MLEPTDPHGDRRFLSQFTRKSATRSDAGNAEVSSIKIKSHMFLCLGLVSEKRSWSDRQEKERKACFVERKKRQEQQQQHHHSQPSLFLIVVWLDSNTEHKGWSRQTPLVRLDRSAAKGKWVPGNVPPQYGRLTERGRVETAGESGRELEGGGGEETTFPPPALKAPIHSPPPHVSACAPASPAWSCYVQRKTPRIFSSGT